MPFLLCHGQNLETYIEIPSDKIVFNQKPDMKAKEITAAGIEALMSGKYKMVSDRFGRLMGRGASNCCEFKEVSGESAG